MLKYVLKRILSALVTIFFIITITFFLMKAIPGNPFAAEKMPNPEIEAAMMDKYGLDQPLWKQYIIYLGNFLRGGFRRLLHQGRPDCQQGHSRRLPLFADHRHLRLPGGGVCRNPVRLGVRAAPEQAD